MKLKLEVFPGDFGLPSLDFDCLRAVLFCKMARIDVELVNQSNIAFNTVPCLKDGDSGAKIAQGYVTIVDYFRKNPYQKATSSRSVGGDNDNWVSDFFINDAEQYSLAVNSHLKPALTQVWWRDEENYSEFLRAWFATRLPFPFNFFYPRRMREKAFREFESILSVPVTKENVQKVEKQVLTKAEIYIRSLSNHLLSQLPHPYLLGSKPTIADVNLLAYLLLIHKAPCFNQQLKFAITQLEPVLKYVEKCAVRWLADAPGKDSPNPFHTKLQDSMTLNKRDLILSGAFAVFAMVFFAVTHGFVDLSDHEDEHSHDDYEEEEN